MYIHAMPAHPVKIEDWRGWEQCVIRSSRRRLQSWERHIESTNKTHISGQGWNMICLICSTAPNDEPKADWMENSHITGSVSSCKEVTKEVTKRSDYVKREQTLILKSWKLLFIWIIRGGTCTGRIVNPYTPNGISPPNDHTSRYCLFML